MCQEKSGFPCIHPCTLSSPVLHSQHGSDLASIEFHQPLHHGNRQTFPSCSTYIGSTRQRSNIIQTSELQTPKLKNILIRSFCRSTCTSLAFNRQLFPQKYFHKNIFKDFNTKLFQSPRGTG